MEITIKNNKINKLRSYSSMFSSSYFKDLIKNEDYSFIQENAAQYDSKKIGTEIITYYDYLQYTYKQLCKQYKNEYIYKNTFINDYLISKYGLKDSIVINEFKVGNSIADLVLFNGTSKAFEIKTELDNKKRLPGQLEDYQNIFKECYVVVPESLANSYVNLNENIGIIIMMINKSGGLKMEQIKSPKINNDISVDTLMRTLRTNEYKAIVKNYYGYLPTMNSFNMFETSTELIKDIPKENLHDLFIKQMKKRKSNTKELKGFLKELRQIGLALNISQSVNNSLIEKLNQPIQL
ncbi:sce7726 family protein [Flavobacterium rakeshii]|uniref:sce7726 family protein n=1 Tax=Flavobacterium rakeshii TaxID=1038845 RepID=UPI002E7BE016|nr:sce7726 family protein [Flavobacterium rakeshii]MEE1899566.1 sce7726 family protein [Flavobacterium rakeshii]